MLSWNYSAIWLGKFASSLEQWIMNFINRINKKRDDILIPWLKKYWPSSLTANVITSLRLTIAVVITIWIFVGDFRGNQWLAILIIFGLLSDLIDGSIARATRQESSWGSIMDKAADNLLIFPLGIAEFWHYSPNLVICSIVAMIVIALIVGLKYFETQGATIPASIFGKLGMIIFSLAVVIGIWPQWLPLAAKLGWIGVCSSMIGALSSYVRYYSIPNFRSLFWRSKRPT